MRIFFFTKYTKAGPSSRYRTFQYLPQYKTAGIDVIVLPLLADKYIHVLYTKGKKSLPVLFAGYIRRFFQLLFLKKYDIIFIEYELFPFIPFFIERILLAGKKNIVLDYDDATFHTYDKSGSGMIRWFCGNKIYKLVQRADIVITGSPYLTEKLRPYAKKIEEIPTSIDFEKYQKGVPGNTSMAKCRIGWIGSKNTSINVLMIKKALACIQEKYQTQLAVIGFSKQLAHELKDLAPHNLEWSEATEISLIKTFNIGIMPLEQNDFNQGKCGFKLIQYMACGIPTISTPLPANIKINRDNTNLFASSTDEWINCLSSMIENLEFYKNETGKRNIEIVKQYYSTEINGPKYISLFKALAQDKQ